MKNQISIYLAGKIQKAHEKPNEAYWTWEDQEAIQKALGANIVYFLNPAIRTDDLSDQKSVFGRDMAQVFSADAIFVDARDRRGLGVGVEMMWAKMHRKPVIAFAPLGSHYHKKSTSLLNVSVEGWVHPFVEGLSDIVVETLDEGAKWLLMALEDPTMPIKGPEWIHEAMQYYLSEQFPTDAPMQDLAKENRAIEARLQSIISLQG